LNVLYLRILAYGGNRPSLPPDRAARILTIGNASSVIAVRLSSKATKVRDLRVLVAFIFS